jgi:hypothetical protein
VDLLSGATTAEVEIHGGEVGPPALIEAGARWVRAGGYDHRGGFHEAFYPVGGGQAVPAYQQTARQAIDLDGPDPLPVMCRPLKRRAVSPADDLFDATWESYDYESPFGLHQDRRVLILDRCGTTRRVAITRAANAMGTLYRHDVSWTEPGALKLRTAKPLARYSWPLPANSGRPDHTKYAVLTQAGGRVYSAAMP